MICDWVRAILPAACSLKLAHGQFFPADSISSFVTERLKWEIPLGPFSTL
jgi:hypothetical protein